MEWKNIQLADLVEYRNGLWTGKTGNFTRAKVIRATEIKDTGSYDLSTSKELLVEERKLSSRRVIPNSILLERSGGGENKPVGRVVIFGDDVLSDTYSFSNFTTLLLPKEDIVVPKYLFYILYFFHLSGKTKTMQKAVTGIRNLEFQRYLEQEISIPFEKEKPSLAEQKRIADELDKFLILKDLATDDINKVQTLLGSLTKLQFEKKDDGIKSAKLNDLCHITKGKSPTLKTKPGKYPLVVTSAERKSSTDYQFDDEAVCIPLVSSTGHGHAALHRIHYQAGKFALANIIVALTAKDSNEVQMKYLYYYLSYYKDELLVSLMRGVANVTIPLSAISEVSVSLPSIQEQGRLVTIFDEVEKLKQELQRRNLLANQLVQSVLNKSFANQT